ncbi:phage fiber-tail adaptor protein [Ectopseudomonas khazarica]|uniref:phage fiber-tail adaptor protein n=1 Tax=Ectopseudomonas khazarica TaxID=2502979 RepID=UPI004034086B
MATTFTKQPADVLDYDVDMSQWFAGSPGDDIERVEIVIASLAEDAPALTIGPSPHPDYVLLGANPQRFKVWLGGGTQYVDYVVTCRVYTAQDRLKEVEFRVKVRDT